MSHKRGKMSQSLEMKLVISYISVQPFPKRQILDSSKDFADDNFIFDEKGRKLLKPIENTVVNPFQNVRKFSKRVENTVGKGEIAPYEQFLLFPQFFQKTCIADT